MSPPLDGPYTSTQTTYDLRRLRLKGLIRRLDGTNTYLLTPEGVRFAAFYTKVHHRLLGPLLAADQPPARSSCAAPSRPSTTPSTTTSTTPASDPPPETCLISQHGQNKEP